MQTTTTHLAGLCLLLAAALPGQEGVPPPPGLIPEQMWPAPTAADWAKPVLIQWQRTWQDAVRLSQETKRAILVCVNMDGEIASEHYAGIRYRDPEITKLYEPYIPVIASVYRHNPRDYDEQGQRIPCPRFGCVTCGEHIALEPLIYAKFLDGKRIAPRHIMVELDGKKTYDVFYTWDTQSVFDQIDNGIKQRAIQPPPIVRGDRSLLEKIASADSQDRSEVEAAYATATAAQRREMLRAALALGADAPIELLRLAAYGLDPELAQQARSGLLQAKDPSAIELIADTLRQSLPADERKQLVEALARFADQSTKARSFANAHRGLASDRSALDTGKWQQALAGGSYAAAPADLGALANARDQQLRQRPADPLLRLDVAEANLLQALNPTDRLSSNPRQAAKLRQALLADAQREVNDAVALGAGGFRVDALLCVLAFAEGRVAEAHRLAIAAAPFLPPDAPGELAMRVLALFAAARQEAIVEAVRNQRDFPPEWTTDVHAAYAVLGKHPNGRDEHVADHFDFLDFFGTPEADAVLAAGLERFPLSPRLHETLRRRLLERQSPQALLAEYERRLAAAEVPPQLHWFAGYAALVAGEAHRRQRELPAARAAYAAALRHYGSYAVTDADNATHYLAIAHAGLARMALEAGDRPACFAALQQSFAANALAAAATDGLGITAVQTADMLRAAAERNGETELVAALDAALAALPKEALEVPEYERNQPNPRPNRRRR
jgi:hypothetical protein